MGGFGKLCAYLWENPGYATGDREGEMKTKIITVYMFHLKLFCTLVIGCHIQLHVQGCQKYSSWFKQKPPFTF